MSSIKSFSVVIVIVAVLFGQITFITPIPMPGPQSQSSQSQSSSAGSTGPLDALLLSEQQQQQQQEQANAIPNYSLLHSLKDRLAAQQQQQAVDDPRLNYLRDLIERLQLLEYQERALLQTQQQPTNPFGYDYDNDLNDFGFNQTPMKRAWDKMSGAWGKRAAGGENWNKFRGMTTYVSSGSEEDFFN